MFPYYFSIGMGYDQYWNEDCTLVILYRKADELRIERRNQELWLQGKYIYCGLCAAAPIFNSNSKKGTRAGKYLEEPFAITQSEVKRKEEEDERKKYNKGKLMMERLSAGMENKFKRGERHG